MEYSQNILATCRFVGSGITDSTFGTSREKLAMQAQVSLLDSAEPCAQTHSLYLPSEDVGVAEAQPPQVHCLARLQHSLRRWALLE